EQDEVRLMLLRQGQAFLPTRRAQDGESKGREQLPHQVALNIVVVDDKDGLPRARVTAHAIFLGGSNSGTRHLREQELHLEAASVADLALDRDVATHDVGEKLGDGEAQPGPGRSFRPRRASSLERLKDAFEVVAVD